MKSIKYLLITIYLFGGIFVFQNCSGDNEVVPDIQNEVATGEMTVKIDGIEYNLIGAASIIPDTSFIWTEESLLITGSSPSGTIYSMSIILYKPEDTQISAGSFNECTSNSIGTKICGTMILGAPFTSGTIKENEGQMNVNLSIIDYQIGGSCIGTFSGTLINDIGSVSITEGKFNFEITE